MEFKVKFVRLVRSSFEIPAISRQLRYVGIAGLDRIRQELGLPNLSLNRVSDYMNSVWTAPVVSLSENIARKSGHFLNTNKITVRISRGNLNFSVKEVVLSEKDDTTGETVGAYIMRVVDEKRIIEEWEKAGFPLEWERCEKMAKYEVRKGFVTDNGKTYWEVWNTKEEKLVSGGSWNKDEAESASKEMNEMEKIAGQ